MITDHEVELENRRPLVSDRPQQGRSSLTRAKSPARTLDASQLSQPRRPSHHPAILLRPWHCAYHGTDAIRELVPRHGGHAALKTALLNAWRWEVSVRDQIADLVASGEDSRTVEDVNDIEVGCDIWFHRRSLPVTRARAEPDFTVTFHADRMHLQSCKSLDALASSIIDASAQQTKRSSFARPTQALAALVDSEIHP